MAATNTSANHGPSHVAELARLDQRVEATEGSLKAISTAVDGVRTDNITTRTDMARQMSEMGNTLATKIENVVTLLNAKIESNAPKPQDWKPIAALGLTAIVIFGGFYGYTQTEAAQNVNRVEALIVQESTDRKQIDHDIAAALQSLPAMATQQIDNANRITAITASISSLWEKTWSKEAQGEYEKRVDDNLTLRDYYARRDLADVKARADAIDASLIKRPEVESALTALAAAAAASSKANTDRIDALSARENDTDKQVNAGWTLSDTVKDMETRLENLRIQLAAPTMTAPIVPVIPTAPTQSPAR